jgi:DNA polymerase V
LRKRCEPSYTVYMYSPSSPPVALTVASQDPAWVWLLTHSVQAGFPSPADDFAVKRIDLNEVLIRHPEATYYLRVRGHSMRDAGIADGDVLLVDRLLPAQHGHVVVAIIEGEFTVKRLFARGGQVKLQADNPAFPDIVPHEGQTMEIWGTVIHAIKTFI